MPHLLTLTQHLISHLADHPDQRDLVLIMNDLATIGKYISRETNRAGLAGVLGAAGLVNIQGEKQQKLDILANETCKRFLCHTGHFAALASEEEAAVVDMAQMGKLGERAKYVVAFDPLDGSSNIDVNVSIGTIFSVHKRLPDLDRQDERQFFQLGRDQVLAGYILYGPSTVLVFSFGQGVHECTLDPGLGEFLVTTERICIPDECAYYSVNETNTPQFSVGDQKFIEYLKRDKRAIDRYVGSFVADFHRNLIKGGVYLYPGVDKDGRGHYEGKLRLNFEAKPMAFLVEQAGGRATDGSQNILDIVPTKLHQRVPLVIGNREIVTEYMETGKL